MTLPTWAGRSKFSYTGSVKTGTRIVYGYGSVVNVASSQYEQLLKHFAKRDVSIGTSRDAKPLGSLGQWLLDNVTKTSIATYVGPILLAEGYAILGTAADRIQFL